MLKQTAITIFLLTITFNAVEASDRKVSNEELQRELQKINADLGSAKQELKELLEPKVLQSMTRFEVSKRKKAINKKMKMIMAQSGRIQKELKKREDYHKSGLPFLAKRLNIKPYTYQLPFGISFIADVSTNDENLRTFKAGGTITQGDITRPNNVLSTPELVGENRLQVKKSLYLLKFDVNLLPFLALDVMGGYYISESRGSINALISYATPAAIPEKVKVSAMIDNVFQSGVVGFGPRLYYYSTYFFVDFNATFMYFVDIKTDDPQAKDVLNKPFVSMTPKIGINIGPLSLYAGVNKIFLLSGERSIPINIPVKPANGQPVGPTGNLTVGGTNYILTQDLTFSVGGALNFGKRLAFKGEYKFNREESGFNIIVAARF